MKKFFVPSMILAAAALVAPLATQAQTGTAPTCPSGQAYTTITYNGMTYYSACFPVATPAPEISASASIGGTAVLLCGAFMLRRRKRTAVVAL